MGKARARTEATGDNGDGGALILLPSGETQAKSGATYQMPKMAKGDYYFVAKPQSDPAGLFHLSDGTLWEIQSYVADTLKRGNVAPYATVKHGPRMLPLWRVDEDGEEWMTSTTYGPTTMGTVNICVYTATKGFLELMGLGSLTSGDKKWFTSHPNVTQDGVSRSFALGVVHGLVAAYPGLGISRVYLPPLTSLSGELGVFADALGVNPIAIADHATSNKEFLSAMGVTDPIIAREIVETCRFEFVSEPPSPSIVMLDSSSVATTIHTGNTGGKWSSTSMGFGHADFVGPRDKVYGKWVLALTIGRDVEYKDPSALVGFKDVTGDEKQTATRKPVSTKELSTFRSKIGGVSASELFQGTSSYTKSWQASTPHTSGVARSGPVAPRHQTKAKTAAETLQDMLDDYFSDGTPPDDAKECPQCHSRTLETTGLAIGDYCWVCGYCDAAATETITTCPICKAATCLEGECTECGFSEEAWAESKVFICGDHGRSLYVTPLVKSELEVKGPYVMSSVHICPECVEESGLLLFEYLRTEREMHLATTAGGVNVERLTFTYHPK